MGKMTGVLDNSVEIYIAEVARLEEILSIAVMQLNVNYLSHSALVFFIGPHYGLYNIQTFVTWK